MCVCVCFNVCVLMCVLTVSCMFFSKYYAEPEGWLKSWVGLLWQENSTLTCGNIWVLISTITFDKFWIVLVYSYPCASLPKEYLAQISGIIFSFSNIIILWFNFDHLSMSPCYRKIDKILYIIIVKWLLSNLFTIKN